MASRFVSRVVASAAAAKIAQQNNVVANRAKPLRLSRFVDSVQVKFKGGNGGDGCVSMLSVFANEFAGPDGGNGGNGGHVVLRADERVQSLNNISRYYSGKPGVRGMGKTMHGANAKHTIVPVPIGTLVLPSKPKELGEHEYDPNKSDIIAELDTEGSMFIASRGGSGGRGNAEFLSNRNRHPNIAEAGARGEENCYELRLNTFADVGLIGLPNSGKSTLMSTLTNAQVKIGDYAFTTLHPQVGVFEFDDHVQVAISDLPGLIEESHKNRGLGLRFLRSVQRCACFLYVIDLSDTNPIGQFEILVSELELFKKNMSFRPHLVLANKIDLKQSRQRLEEFRNYLSVKRPDTRVIAGSSLTGIGLEELRLALRNYARNSE